MKFNKKAGVPIGTIAIIIIVLIAGLGMWWYFTQQQRQTNEYGIPLDLINGRTTDYIEILPRYRVAIPGTLKYTITDWQINAYSQLWNKNIASTMPWPTGSWPEIVNTFSEHLNSKQYQNVFSQKDYWNKIDCGNIDKYWTSGGEWIG